MCRQQRDRRDAGQVTPLVALLVAAVLGATVLVASLGTLVVDRVRAGAAADASALAGAVAGRADAAEVARANGGELRRFSVVDGDAVEVTVRLGRAEATARARRSGGRWRWPSDEGVNRWTPASPPLAEADGRRRSALPGGARPARVDSP